MTKTIYTIGHSTHAIDEFLEMLQSFDIKIVADVRKLPGSRKYPHFDQDNLRVSLDENKIRYRHFTDLGGRRKPDPNSENTAWHNASFRAYADYMETAQFQEAVEKLEELAAKYPTAYMCSEAVYWRCHRSMVSDYLMARGWNVVHIMGKGKSQPHKFTAPANIVDGKLTYRVSM
ncbi:MAG: DUF488 domain-containing protein [Flavobacterium sp.]|nr:DUF488 domain-containing protein [Flavobacterium sp.]